MSTYTQTLKSDESSLLVHYLLRPIAYPIALAAHRLGLSANALTIISGLSWMLSLVTFPLGALCFTASPETASGTWLLLLSAFLWCLGTILDVADGSLARLTQKSGAAGFFLDYVFHLLFKPGFFVSLGLGIALISTGQNTSSFNLALGLLALFTLPLSAAANWSASTSSAEHVLCELQGKNKLPTLPRELWLGSTDSAHSIDHKRRGGPLAILSSLLKESLSYYGQFMFFALLLVIDLILYRSGIRTVLMPCTASTYSLLLLVFLFRIPARIARDFVRMRFVDSHSSSSTSSRSR